ncbi:Isy1-like splicing [Corchorus olitorius]|uniref:Isy1-like splicing n=1 Tax=Corchorus olitorius TaxID=93759 RepID=A0A1R3K874_9ROSI|nr:Isy1-like splicing [Corchorus olitorius]
MARNEEKARSELNRFVAQKAAEKKKPKERRPYLASMCRNLAEADKWRHQIITEIDRKVTDIQNEGLGEHRLRDLNDEINKLFREKSHWERRIVELGGPNHAKHDPKMTDLEGNIIDVPNPSGRGPGYRYFGAAKKLPGVRELFEKPAPELRKRKNSYDNYKRIDASYYGYSNRDGEDGVSKKVEGKAEEVVTAGAAAAREVLFEEEKEREFVKKKKKKMELLSKYASQELLEEQSEAKDMLNIHT